MVECSCPRFVLFTPSECEPPALQWRSNIQNRINLEEMFHTKQDERRGNPPPKKPTWQTFDFLLHTPRKGKQSFGNCSSAFRCFLRTKQKQNRHWHCRKVGKNCNTLTCVLLGRCCHMNSWSSSLKRRSVPHNCCVAACCTNTHEVLGFNFHVLYRITSRGGRALQPARDGDLNASQSAPSPRAAGKQTDRQTDPNTQRQRRNEFESQATSLLE